MDIKEKIKALYQEYVLQREVGNYHRSAELKVEIIRLKAKLRGE